MKEGEREASSERKPPLLHPKPHITPDHGKETRANGHSSHDQCQNENIRVNDEESSVHSNPTPESRKGKDEPNQEEDQEINKNVSSTSSNHLWEISVRNQSLPIPLTSVASFTIETFPRSQNKIKRSRKHFANKTAEDFNIIWEIPKEDDEPQLRKEEKAKNDKVQNHMLPSARQNQDVDKVEENCIDKSQRRKLFGTSEDEGVNHESRQRNENILSSQKREDIPREVWDALIEAEEKVNKIEDIVREMSRVLDTSEEKDLIVIMGKTKELIEVIESLQTKIPKNIALHNKLCEEMRSNCQTLWLSISKRLKILRAIAKSIQNEILRASFKN